MRNISKKPLRDEANQPVAVQTDYADWLEIERLFGPNAGAPKVTDLAEFHGVLKDLSEDPLEYQRRIRSEWDRG